MPPPSVEGFSELLKKVSSRKAPGPDGISYMLLKHLPIALLINLVMVFACSERCGEWPEQLWCAVVAALQKKEGITGAMGSALSLLLPVFIGSGRSGGPDISWLGHSLGCLAPPWPNGGPLLLMAGGPSP